MGELKSWPKFNLVGYVFVPNQPYGRGLDYFFFQEAEKILPKYLEQKKISTLASIFALAEPIYGEKIDLRGPG